MLVDGKYGKAEKTGGAVPKLGGKAEIWRASGE